jgi:hypothetical protein
MGEKPDNITTKFWRDELPPLLDAVGITIKKNKTERCFAELIDLQYRCSVLSRVAHDTGDLFFTAGDLLARKLVTDSAYVDRLSNGELVTYPKPASLPECTGKARITLCSAVR